MSHAKIVIVGAVIAAAWVTPAIIQYQINTRLKGEIAGLHSQLAVPPRASQADQGSTDHDELERLRLEHTELIRLRGEVASLRQRVTDRSTNLVASARRDGSGDPQPIAPVSEAEITEFLQRPPTEQGQFLGAMRGQLQAGGALTPEWARHRLLAEKVRPSLDQLESRPSDIADFQTSFIQAAVGVQDESTMAQIRDIIQKTYEQAVAAHLDAPSRPPEGIEDWAVRRDALDRQATKNVQQLFTSDERERFDRLFLGVMGIDLGIGDGAQHRFVREDGAIVFPSEQPQPIKPP